MISSKDSLHFSDMYSLFFFLYLCILNQWLYILAHASKWDSKDISWKLQRIHYTSLICIQSFSFHINASLPACVWVSMYVCNAYRLYVNMVQNRCQILFFFWKMAFQHLKNRKLKRKMFPWFLETSKAKTQSKDSLSFLRINPLTHSLVHSLSLSLTEASLRSGLKNGYGFS